MLSGPRKGLLICSLALGSFLAAIGWGAASYASESAGAMIADPASPAPKCTKIRAKPGSLSPYSDDNFKSALENAEKLQFPGSRNACLTNQDIRKSMIAGDNFSRNAAGQMQFSFQNGVKSSDASATTRLELRGYSFDARSTNKIWDGHFLIGAVPDRASNFTVGQVYGEKDGKPILRIEFVAERQGVKNHLWAIYRTDADDGQFLYQDIGAAPESETPIRVRITYNGNSGITLFSSATGKTYQFSENFGFWAANGKTTYFKTGCYIQRSGACDVRFTKLHFDR